MCQRVQWSLSENSLEFPKPRLSKSSACIYLRVVFCAGTEVLHNAPDVSVWIPMTWNHWYHCITVSLIHRSSIFRLVKGLTKNTELCREHRPGFFLREKGCQDHRNRANASLAFTPSCWKVSNVQNTHLFWRMGRYAQIVSMATALLQPHAFVRIRPSLCQQSAPWMCWDPKISALWHFSRRVRQVQWRVRYGQRMWCGWGHLLSSVFRAWSEIETWRIQLESPNGEKTRSYLPAHHVLPNWLLPVEHQHTLVWRQAGTLESFWYPTSLLHPLSWKVSGCFDCVLEVYKFRLGMLPRDLFLICSSTSLAMFQAPLKGKRLQRSSKDRNLQQPTSRWVSDPGINTIHYTHVILKGTICHLFLFPLWVCSPLTKQGFAAFRKSAEGFRIQGILIEAWRYLDAPFFVKDPTNSKRSRRSILAS